MLSIFSRRSYSWVLPLILAAFGSSVHAQLLDSALPRPRLLTVFPPGGKVGSTVEVTVAGTDLDDPERLLFSHPGIKAEPIVPPAPPPDPKKPPKQPPVKQPITRFKVTIPADAPLGLHDVRLVGRWGVSNPRAFLVGDLTEVLEKEPNNDVEQAQRVELNSTINGNLANNIDVDYYVFAGKKGQRVVFSCLASTIDSRFNPELRVYDSKGRLHVTNRNYHGNDALTDLVLPEDGDYLVRLVEFAHLQGNAESFYRLSISTAPWIDAVYPPMVEPGKSTQVTFWGRNLPGGKPDPSADCDGRPLDKLTVSVNVPADPQATQRLAFSGRLAPNQANLDGFEYRLRNAGGVSNPVLLTYATAPIVLDNETARTAATAQEVPIPCEIAGRIEKRRDRDWYAFTAKKGEAINVEVISERLGAPDQHVLPAPQRGHQPGPVRVAGQSRRCDAEILRSQRRPRRPSLRGPGGWEISAAGRQPAGRRPGRSAPRLPGAADARPARLPAGGSALRRHPTRGIDSAPGRHRRLDGDRLPPGWLHRRHCPDRRGFARGSDLPTADTGQRRPLDHPGPGRGRQCRSGVERSQDQGHRDHRGTVGRPCHNAGGARGPARRHGVADGPAASPHPHHWPAGTEPRPGRARESSLPADRQPRQEPADPRRQGNADRQTQPALAGVQAAVDRPGAGGACRSERQQ